MSRISVKMPHWLKRLLFGVLTLSWLSGVTFYVLNRWFGIEGEFGTQKHPWQYPVLQIHGFAAFIMLMSLGAVIAHHVPAAWKTKRLRWAGISLFSVLGVQLISAYLLYYLGNEDIRPIVSTIHTYNGLCIPLVLTVHIMLGIRSRGRRIQSQQGQYIQSGSVGTDVSSAHH